jgi:hypothetical protein
MRDEHTETVVRVSPTHVMLWLCDAEPHVGTYTTCLLCDCTNTQEFELSCQLVLPMRPVDKPSIKWKVWKTFTELQEFDECVAKMLLLLMLVVVCC